MRRLMRLHDNKAPAGLDARRELMSEFERRTGNRQYGRKRISSFQDLQKVSMELALGGDRAPLRREYGKHVIQVVASMRDRISELIGGNGTPESTPATAASSLLDAILEKSLLVERLIPKDQRAFAEEVFTRATTHTSLQSLLQRLNLSPMQLEQLFEGEYSSVPASHRDAPLAGSRVSVTKGGNGEEMQVKSEEPECVAGLKNKTCTIYDLTAGELGALVDFATEVSEYGMKEAPLHTFLNQCNLPLVLYRELMRLETPQAMWQKLRALQKKTVGHATMERKVRREKSAPQPQHPAIDPDATLEEILGDDEELVIVDHDQDEETNGERSEESSTVDLERAEEGEDEKNAPNREEDTSGEMPEKKEGEEDPMEEPPEQISLLEDPAARASFLILWEAIPYYRSDAEAGRNELCALLDVDPTALASYDLRSVQNIDWQDMKAIAKRSYPKAMRQAFLSLSFSPHAAHGTKSALLNIFSINSSILSSWGGKYAAQNNAHFDLSQIKSHKKGEEPIEGEHEVLQDLHEEEKILDEIPVQQDSILEDPRACAALLVLNQAIPCYVDPKDVRASSEELFTAFGVDQDDGKVRTLSLNRDIPFVDMKQAKRRVHLPMFIGAIHYLCSSPYATRGSRGVVDRIFSLNNGDRPRWAKLVSVNNDYYDFGALAQASNTQEGGSDDETPILLDSTRKFEADTHNEPPVVNSGAPADSDVLLSGAEPVATEDEVYEEGTASVEESVIENPHTAQETMPTNPETNVMTTTREGEQEMVNTPPVVIDPRQEIHELRTLLYQSLTSAREDRVAFIQVIQQQMEVISALRGLKISPDEAPAVQNSGGDVRVIVEVHVNNQKVPTSVSKQELPHSS